MMENDLQCVSYSPPACPVVMNEVFSYIRNDKELINVYKFSMGALIIVHFLHIFYSYFA